MKASGISLVWLLVSGALIVPVGISSAFAIQSVPFAPTQLNATAVSGTQIFLVWDPPVNASQSGVTGYKLEISPSCTNSFNFLANTTTASFVSSGLTNGTCYQFKVEAINTSGFSNSSNIASASTLSVPSAPTALSALTISSSQINLSWIAPANNGGTPVQRYEIQRENSCLGSFVTVTSANSNTTYSDTGLSANTCYRYKVSAINAIGTSLASNNATATTLQIPILHVPSAPTGLVVTTVSNSSLKLTWNKPSNDGGTPITGYLIQRNGTIIVNNTFSNNTSYTDTNLLPSHGQTYQVAAWNSIGKSPDSNLVFGFTSSIITSGNGTNSTGSNLGQLISDFIHKRNELLQQQRQEIVTIIHDCHTQIKNAPPGDKKQIQEDCKAKIKQVEEKYKDLRKQLKEELQAIKSQFKETNHDQDNSSSIEHGPKNETKHDDKNETKHDDKEDDHSVNQTSNFQKDFKHIEDDLKHIENNLTHLGKKAQAHDNSEGHKGGHNEDD